MEPTASWGKETSKQAITVCPVSLQINCQKWYPEVYFLCIKNLALTLHLPSAEVLCRSVSATLLILLFPASPVTSSSPHPVATLLSTVCFVSQLHHCGNHVLFHENAFLLPSMSPCSWLFYFHLPGCFPHL